MITLTKKELSEIKAKGVLKTTKMYHQKEEQIARAVAGAHDEIILSSRAFTKEDRKETLNETTKTISELNKSKEWADMTAKEKKNFRHRKRKQVKKYIAQGRLPENYDNLPKEEKDRLYEEVRELVKQENFNILKDPNLTHLLRTVGSQPALISSENRAREGDDISKASSQPKKENGKHQETKHEEIEIDTKDIDFAESTQMTTNTETSKQHEQEQDTAINQNVNKASARKAKNPQTFRHSSAPRKDFGGDDDEEDRKEIEKLKLLMADGMDDTPSKPNIPKLNTNLIKKDDKANDKVTKRGPKIDEDVHLAIVDMGNGCWTHHHFTSQIQTRQYRSPETIIGVPYGPSADIWSLACMVFELLTGDFLFEPRKGYYYDKDDDHLAQMIELLGPMPKNFALSGKNSKRFFDSTGHLRRIRGLNYWPLHRVLIEKYRFVPKEAEALADFLQNMLTWYPDKRATAKEMLEHPWLKMPRNDHIRLGDEEYEKMMEVIKKNEETEKKKKELEVILREGSMDPETLSKKIRSENMSELAESHFEK